MHTPQEKKACRAKWVNDLYQEETKGKRFEDGYSRIERTKGKMYTLGGIVQLYGGWTWKPAVERGCAHSEQVRASWRTMA